jgi:hypothetical protein
MPMLPRLVAAIPLVLATAAGAAAQQPRPALQDCGVVASEGLPGLIDANAVGLVFAGEGLDRHVTTARPRSAQGAAPTTELAPVRRGVSYGATLAPGPSGEWLAEFTLATVEEAGTVLLETWRWGPTGPTGRPPAYAWSRLRCGP